MAIKYWYVANNGSASWSTGGNWYDTSGGPPNGGVVVGAPTVDDDAILDSNSGTGTITITSNASTCLSLDASSFSGTFAGTATITIIHSLYLGPSMTLSHTGRMAFGSAAYGPTYSGVLDFSTQTVVGTIVFQSPGSYWDVYDLKTVSTSSVTLSGGEISTYNSNKPYALECGLFISTGSGLRAFWGGSSGIDWNITGFGTVWNVSGTNITAGDYYNNYPTGYLNITNSSSNTKTITHSLTGFNTPFQTTLGGTGNGSFVISSSAGLNDFYVTNTGGAQLTFNSCTIYGNYFSFGNSNVNWNSTSSVITFVNTGDLEFILSPNSTITFSGDIVMNMAANSYIYYTSNGKSLTGTFTLNNGSTLYAYDSFSCNGTFTLNSGIVEYTGAPISIGALSSSNSNTRTFSTPTLYLTGTGTLISASVTTGLTFAVDDIYLTSTSSLSKTVSFSGIICAINSVNLEGSGSGLTSMTFAASSVTTPYVYIRKLGGTLNIGTSTMRSLVFVEGSTITWANGSNVHTILEDLILCSSMTVSTSSSTISFPLANEYSSTFVTANKTFSGTLSVLNPNGLFVNGNYTSTSTSTSAISVATQGSVTFSGNVQVSSGSFVSNSGTSGGGAQGLFANVDFRGSLTANAVSFTDTYVQLRNATVNGAMSFSTYGSMYVYPNSTLNLGSFASSTASAVRDITLNNAIINLNGIGTVWNTSSGGANLTLSAASSTINITNKTSNTVTVLLGNAYAYGNFNIDRSQPYSAGFAVSTIVGGIGDSFANFIDTTKMTPPGALHDIVFSGSSSATYTQIRETFKVGNPDNLTRIYSSSANPFYLQKTASVSNGLVICSNVYVQLSRVLPTNTWYAIGSSTNTTSSDGGSNVNWIFGVPSRRLGSQGVG